MPVRIDNSTDPASFAISADKLQSGIDNFKHHYFLTDGSGEFISDFSIPWNDLNDAVETYQTQNPTVDVSDIALRFIHCYDPASNALYLRLQICQMQLTTITEYNSSVYQLLNNPNVAWYDIRENSMTPTPAASCTLFDQVYLDSFEYKLTDAEETGEVLADDGGLKFVRTLTFPWEQEILMMYNDNGAPQDPPNDVRIHFCSTSYTSVQPGSSAVLWPHGLVLYLEENGEKLLNNEDTITIFSYKGADLATKCPPNCNSYVTPVNVTS